MYRVFYRIDLKWVSIQNQFTDCLHREGAAAQMDHRIPNKLPQRISRLDRKHIQSTDRTANRQHGATFWQLALAFYSHRYGFHGWRKIG
jgi:hypothetical protein